MFDWTAPRVLAAIDAGIAEVISTYNNIYLFFVRHNARLDDAHSVAMTQTISWLNDIEAERLMIAAIDRCDRSVEYYLAGCAGTMADYVDALAYAHNTSAETWAEPRDAADRFAAAYEGYEDSMNPGNWA